MKSKILKCCPKCGAPNKCEVLFWDIHGVIIVSLDCIKCGYKTKLKL